MGPRVCLFGSRVCLKCFKQTQIAFHHYFLQSSFLFFQLIVLYPKCSYLFHHLFLGPVSQPPPCLSPPRLSRLHPSWHEQPLVLEALHRIVRLFGPGRCMFASNAPVDGSDGWGPERVFQALGVAKDGWGWNGMASVESFFAR